MKINWILHFLFLNIFAKLINPSFTNSIISLTQWIRRKHRWKKHTIANHQIRRIVFSWMFLLLKFCSTSPPGGNQVDGLPPVVTYCHSGNSQQTGSPQIGEFYTFFRFCGCRSVDNSKFFFTGKLWHRIQFLFARSFTRSGNLKWG